MHPQAGGGEDTGSDILEQAEAKIAGDSMRRRVKLIFVLSQSSLEQKRGQLGLDCVYSTILSRSVNTLIFDSVQLRDWN